MQNYSNCTSVKEIFKGEKLAGDINEQIEYEIVLPLLRMTWICNDLTRKIMEQLILVATEIHFDEFDDKTRFGKQSVMHRK
jgi:hypothetical protein